MPLWAPPRTFRPARAELLRVALPSGGALRAHAWWLRGKDGTALRAPAAIVVHGVGGSSSSHYVTRASVSLHREGFHVVRLDLRGAGESIPDARELYHAGLTEDLHAALSRFGSEACVDGIALIGFSLGGHVVLRLVGEIGGRDPGPLRAAIAVSAPVDLLEVTREIERPRSLAYQAFVLRALVRQARAFARAHPGRARYDVGSLGGLRTIRAYDRLVIAPMHGFASAEDYYVRVSAGPLLGRLVIPTLLIHAEDDPLVPARTVHPWVDAAPAALTRSWTDRGGHVGWFAGFGESAWIDTWAIRRALEFLRGLATWSAA